MKITPLFNRLVVKPVPVETVSKGGIYLPPPDGTDKKPIISEIVAMGTEVCATLKVGDKVAHGMYAPSSFEHEGVELLAMCDKDVLFVLSD